MIDAIVSTSYGVRFLLCAYARFSVPHFELELLELLLHELRRASTLRSKS